MRDLSELILSVVLVAQRHGRVQETQLKCTKARNDYLLNLAAANAAMDKYYLQDISTLIDVWTLWFWVFWVTSVSLCFLLVFKIQIKCDKILKHHLLLPVGSVATWVSISLWRGWWGATWPVDGVSRRRRRWVSVSWSLPWHLWTRVGTEMRYCSSMTPPSVSHSDSTTTLMRETRYNHPLISPLRFFSLPFAEMLFQLFTATV